MWRGWILLLVAGCRGLLGIEEAQVLDSAAPNDAPADSGSGSWIDAPPDAAPITCAPTQLSDFLLPSQGSWMTVDPASGRATRLDEMSSSVTAAEGYTLPGAVYAVILTPTFATYDAPRLSPGGAELYLRHDDASGPSTLRRSTWMGAGAWATPQVVTLKSGTVSVPVGVADTPSPPTLTNPRRMIVAGTAGYAEYTETTPTEWSRVAGSVPAFGVSFRGQASISPDGLRLVFRGQVTGQLDWAFVVKRDSLATNFMGPAVHLPTDPSSSVQTPFLTADCKHLYYTNSIDGQLHHVIYP